MLDEEQAKEAERLLSLISDEEKNAALEGRLNAALKPYGLSLDNKIRDVYNLSLNPLQDKKEIPKPCKPIGNNVLPLRDYVAELRKNNLFSLNSLVIELLSDVSINDGIGYERIKGDAYKRTAENPTIRAFELLFAQQYNQDQRIPLSIHIAKWLNSIAYGVEVAYLIPELNNGKSNKKKKAGELQTLKEIFINEDAYNKIMYQLSDEEMTDKDTFVWCDNSNGHKTRIVALLNDLFYKGYYNVEQMPNPETFKDIAKNTFKVDISKRTFHSNKIPEYRKEHFYFIEKYRPE